MRKNIHLALCVGALALPLAACNDPQGYCDRGTDLWSFAHPAAAGTFVDPDGRYRQRSTAGPMAPSPIAANGMVVNAYSSGLDHPRWLYVLPNGDVLVAESHGPPRPTYAGIERSDEGAGAEMGGRRRSERQPHHAAARRDRDGAAETRITFLGT